MTEPPQPKIPRPRPALMIAGTAVVSFASTLLGIGGGAFLVPMLAAWVPVRLKKAVGTSLATILAVVTVGMIVQVIRAPGDVLWAEAGLIVAGAFAGAPVGRSLLRVLPRQMFRYIFAVFLLVVAVRMFGLIPQATHMVGEAPVITEWQTVVFALITGFLAGAMSSLFGIGGGMVIVPALMLGFSDVSDNFSVARATSLCTMVPITAWSAFLHWRRGNVRLSLIPRLLPLAAVFATVGVFAAYWIRADFLTLLFGTLLVIMAIKLGREKVRPYVPGDDDAPPAKP